MKNTKPTPAAASFNQTISASIQGSGTVFVLFVFCQEQNRN
jgi:hypothetical protein